MGCFSQRSAQSLLQWVHRSNAAKDGYFSTSLQHFKFLGHNPSPKPQGVAYAGHHTTKVPEEGGASDYAVSPCECVLLLHIISEHMAYRKCWILFWVFATISPILSDLPYPTTGNIFEPTTWTSAISPVNITRDLTVYPGASLVIEAGVRVVFDACHTITISGAASVTIRGTMAAPVYFKGSMEWNRWIWPPRLKPCGRGIYGKDDSLISIAHAHFTGFKHCVYKDWDGGPSSAVVTDSIFADSVSGISFYMTTGTIINCTVRNTTSYGINGRSYSYRGDSIKVENSSVLDNNVGIYGHDRRALQVKGCVVARNDVGIQGTALVSRSYLTDNRVGVLGVKQFTIEHSNMCGNTDYNFMTTEEIASIDKFVTDTVWWGTADTPAAITTISDARTVPGVGLLVLDVASTPVPGVPVDGRCQPPNASSSAADYSNPAYPPSGNIFEPTTWTSAISPVNITRDLTVYPGASLVIEAGVRVVFDACHTITISGAASVTIRGTMAAPVYFKGSMEWNRWIWPPRLKPCGRGIYGKDDSLISIAHAHFTGFKHCVYKDWDGGPSSAVVTDSIFADSVSGISFYMTTGTIINCTVRNTTSYGINGRSYSYRGDSIKVENSSVLDNNVGINGHDRRALQVKGCVVARNDVGIQGTALVSRSYLTDNRVGVLGVKQFTIEHSNMCGNTDYNFMTTEEIASIDKFVTDTVWWGTADTPAAITMISDARTVPGVGLLVLDVASTPVPGVPVDGRCQPPNASSSAADYSNPAYPPSGNIFEPTTWTSAISPVNITRDLTVYPGASLVIEAGVRVVFDACHTITISGAASVTIRGTMAAPVYFKGSMEWNRWIWPPRLQPCGRGIYGKDDSLISIAHAHFTGFKHCVYKDWDGGPSSAVVTDSIFADSVSGISFYMTTGTIINCTVRNTTSYGINGRSYSYRGDSIKVENSSVLDNNVGIYGHDRRALQVKGCVVARNDVGIQGTALVSRSYLTDNRVGVLGVKQFTIEHSNMCGNTDYNFMTTEEIASIDKFVTDTVWWGTADTPAAITTISDARTVPGVGLLVLDVASTPVPGVPMDANCSAPGLDGWEERFECYYPDDSLSLIGAIHGPTATLDRCRHLCGRDAACAAYTTDQQSWCYTYSLVPLEQQHTDPKRMCGFSPQPWTAAVQLSNDKQSVFHDIGEAAFNAAFEACPVVRYRRNGKVDALYARTSPVPPGFNAYRLFTDTWASADNRLNVDFELYSAEADMAQGQRQWQYCNFDDPDVGFPRDCGPSASVANRWFSLPGGRFNARDARGAGFDVYNGTRCPARIREARDKVVATVYEGPGCTLRARGLKESDFPAGRHANGWDACYGTWDDGSAIEPVGSAVDTRLGSFRVHSGYEVNTSSPCHDDFFYPAHTNRLTRVTAADGCVDVDYAFNYLEYNSSTPPVDCAWGGYGAWSACSVTCGGGQQSRTRSKTVVESNGGVCPGGSVEVQSCNTHSCGVCRYTVTSVGDGYQGPWGNATFAGPCGLTFSWTKHRPGTTGLPAILQAASTGCGTNHQLGIIGLYGSDGVAHATGSCGDQNIRVKEVRFEQLADRDCRGYYSACTRACETAGQRTFTQTVPRQANGAACPAAANCSFGDGQCIGPGGGDGTDGVYLFGGAIGNDVWKLVRRQPPSDRWHAATDNLAGTAVYGTYHPSDAVAASFSIKFDASSGLGCDQFLFMSGDRAKWLVATNTSVAGAYPPNAPRPVERSSANKFPHMVRWESRLGVAEDPWISLTDHYVAVPRGDVIYGEAGWPGAGGGPHDHHKLLNEHNGANVFCRVAAGTCHNGRKDGAETGRDCGGECDACDGCSKVIHPPRPPPHRHRHRHIHTQANTNTRVHLHLRRAHNFSIYTCSSPIYVRIHANR